MKGRILQEFFRFIIENRRWWIGTIVIMLLLLSVLLFLTESSPIAPFIYALF